MDIVVPIYTLLALIFLIPPIAIILWKDSHLDKKKIAVVLFFCIIATILWDSVAIRLGIWGFLKQNTTWWILGIPLGIFNAIGIIGFYTSLPSKHVFTGKW